MLGVLFARYAATRSLMVRALMVAPAATWIAVRPLRLRWLWGAAVLAVQAAMVFLLKATGLLDFGGHPLADRAVLPLAPPA